MPIAFLSPIDAPITELISGLPLPWQLATYLLLATAGSFASAIVVETARTSWSGLVEWLRTLRERKTATRGSPARDA
jgi:hypothetical protein